MKQFPSNDGWSLGVFNRELSGFYATLHAGHPPAGPPLAVQYADYAEWQRQWLQGEVLEKQLRYWLRHLADAPGLELPTDHPRPPQQTYAGATLPVIIPGNLAARLSAFNRELEVTPFMSLLAVFQVLLSRYSGQTDILVGTPIANRQRIEVEDLIGFFVNTLVMRGDLSGDPGFRELVNRGRLTALDAYQHQDLPFEELVRQVNPTRDPSRHPLFQVTFALQNAPEQSLELTGVNTTVQPLPGTTTHFDLELHLWQRGEKWDGNFVYNADLFDVATIRRMAGHYLTLMEALLTEPERPVMEVPMLTAAERHQLLVAWNDTATDYPRDKCVHQLFEEQVARTPDAVAVVFEEQCLTYRELNGRANQVAHHLRTMGVGPDVLIGVLVERSLELVVGLLGILKAGGAYVGLDAGYPAERLNFMITDARMPVLLTLARHESRLPNRSVRLLMMDADWPAMALESESNPTPTAGPHHLAYVIYTSGTTGQPKGVMISHRALANHMGWMLHTFGFTASDRTLQRTSTGFDASVWEFHAPLLSGGCLIMAPPEAHRDPALLVNTIIEQRVSVVQFVPTLFEMILREPRWSECRSLRQVFCGGEVLAERVVARFFESCEAGLANLYGPTEATIDATFHLCAPDEMRSAPPIGRPIDNARVFIVDPGLEPVPIGGVGELLIGGDGLACGYLNQPQLTAERFIPDPFAAEAGGRLYRTGDRCRWLPDGTIEFLGRLDQQVKIRGFRIELEEVEAALTRLPGLEQAAVSARPAENGTLELAAWVVARNGSPVSLSRLREELRQWLPEYMIPTAITVVDQLPLTPNGKLDRAALPTPTQASEAGERPYSLPRSPLEETLAGIWAEVFNLPQVGRDDNFFDLGGHSLLTTRVAMRVEKTLGLRLSMRDLFDQVTVAQLAEWLVQEYPTQVAAESVDFWDEPDNLTPPAVRVVPAEPRVVAEGMSDPAGDHPPDRCIHEVFKAQVERTPDAVAVVFEGQSLTYAELNRRADLVAHVLAANGVAPEVLVGAVLDRSLDWAVAFLAVLKAGGAIVPLAPDLPSERLSFIISDTAPPVVLTHSTIRGRLPSMAATVICLDHLPVADFDASSAVAVRPWNLAWVIYTSGSTGLPKGVLLTHEAYLNYHRAAIDFFGLEPTDRCLQFGSLSFDVGIDQLLTPLLAGATVVMCGTEIWHPAVLADHVRSLRLTVIHLPAAYWNEWVEVLQRDAVRDAIGALRLVEVGGDVMPVAAVRGWVGLGLRGVRLVNRYGPTESTMFSTAYEVPSDESVIAALERIPIGKPVGPRTIHLLDSQRKEVADGEVGEIFIGGETLAHGYLKRPELTAERFLADPFSARPEARWYQTGDLARRLPDGNLEFLGRADFQVKLRGFRIELGEIDEVMRRHPAVHEAITVLRTNPTGDRHLVVFLVAKADGVILPPELRSHAIANLPDYMVPARFVTLARLPLTPNGKADRLALSQLECPEPSSAAERIRPRNRVEAQLAAIWQTALGIAEIGIRDNFFELGAHSLLAMRVIARIRHDLKVNVTVRQLLEAQTIEALAGQLGAVGVERQVPIEPVPPELSPRLSFAQERLWFLAEYEPESTAYHLPRAHRLAGNLRAEGLERALAEIVRRHDALRTTFRVIDGQTVQIIAPRDGFQLPVVDLTGLPPAEREPAARRLIAEELAIPFDLAAGPLFKARLFRLAAADHILLVNFHHSVSDGWSLGVFNRELSGFYAALHAGHPPAGPPLAVQYADYAEWQRQWLQGEVLEKQTSYWLRQLAAAPALELPTDHPRPPRQTYAGARLPMTIPSELAARLNAFNRELAVTPFMSLLAVFQVLLARYSGQTDILVGTPIANRQRIEVEDLIGFFVNTLVMRGDLSGDPSFREVVKRGRLAAFDAYQHQDLPFEELVRVLNPTRDLSRHPLFQVLFALQNAPEQSLELAGLATSEQPLPGTTTHFDLELHLWQRGEGWAGHWVYNTDLFEAAMIERMTGHFLTLLEALLADPERSVMEAPMLTGAERHQLLVEWNDTAKEYPEHTWIHQLFEDQVKRTPDAVAVEFDTDRWSYRELDQQANRVACRLQDMGVGIGCMVAVCIERSGSEVAGVLGVLKTGAAYVPLDPAYPPERLSYMLEDSGVRVVLVQEQFVARIPGNLPMLQLKRIGQADGPIPEPLPVGADPSRNPGYVIYTSGSTGHPKGVCLPHTALVNLICWQRNQSNQGVAGRTLHSTSLGFDVSFQEIFSTLCCGGTLVIFPVAAQGDFPILLQMIEDQRIERVFLPFVALEQLAEVASVRSFYPGSLREVITAGEQLRITPAIISMFASGGIRLINQYGPTEAHVVSYHELVGPSGGWPLLPPIGRPIHNVSLHLLDAGGQPVPVGVGGELFIGGVAVALGYLNRHGLTAERFIPDRFSADPAARLYRTGDRCRRLPDGTLKFLGRMDLQVKIRGYRVEPEEVEAVLQRHPAVRLCAVTAHEIAPGERRLAAYVIPVDAGACDPRDLRDFLHQYLPNYMVPTAFERMGSLPLTASGKVDRRALPAPDLAQAAGEGPDIPPQSGMEEVIAGIWAEVLGIRRIGRLDNFFELGGHSLLATRVALRLEQTLGIRISVRQLFEAQTIAALASQLGRAGLEYQAPMQPVPRESPLRLSFAQERLWFLAEYEPESTAYHLSQAHRLVGDLRAELLELALAEVVQRHESLRTTFRMINGKAVQIIAPCSGFLLPTVDLTDMPQPEREPAAQRLIAEGLAIPFNLAAGPLFKAKLFRLAAADHILLVSFHHSISDGWSLGVFNHELSILYAALQTGHPPAGPPLAVQYADYAEWQRQWLQGEVLEEQLRYWLRHLADAPGLELPTDHPRPLRQTYAGATLPMTIPGALAARLNAFNRELAVTPFMSLLAVFQVLLARYSGQTDILVGTPIANRQRVEVEDLIGFFVNTLVMRGDLSGNPDFREVVKRGRLAALDAYEHQDLPFEELVRVLNPARDLSRHPLFQVMFALQNAPAQPLDLAGLATSEQPLPGTTTHFDLELHLWQRGDEWGGSFVYNTELFDAAMIERMAGHYLTLLEALLTEPERPVMEVPMLTAAERHQLLVAWNDTATDYPRDKCVHQLFEEQVARTPDAVAVEMAGRRLTYRELNEGANQLAGDLHERGVGAETRVGLCLERSPDLVVCLLGILKAGAAYVPLDPHFPPARLALILEDAAVGLLITQRPLAGRCAGFAGPQLWWDEWHPAATAAGNPALGVPAAAAYVMYTSGSTGRPKGVVVEHRAVVNFLHGMRERPGLGPADVLVAVTTVSFDISVLEIFLPLTVGARLVMAPEAVRADGTELAALLSASGASVFQATPTTWQMLLLSGWQGDGKLKALTGGEPLPEDLAAVLLACCGEVWNLYGPTETTVWSLSTRIGQSDAVTIGRPITNTLVRVVDRQGQLVPVGVPGELWIGGAGLARGYLNRPGLTAEKFIPDPFGREPAARLYRTGDRVRWRPDGNLEFLGRMDTQVKIRGYRIELAEIEGALRRQAEIADAVVVVQEAVAGGKGLVAYVVARGKDMPETSILRQRLAEWLPDYMVPGTFVRLERLPLTPNGKVDRQALPASEVKPSDSEHQSNQPISLLELELLGVWRRLFQRPDIGRRDDFFALGGHSLLAARLVAEIDQMFDCKLPIAALFQAPTVELLARRLTDENWAPAWTSLVPLQPQGTRPPLYFVHGWGGSVFGFLDLARQLPADQPCYGIQAVGLDGKADRHITVEAMAAHYVREIISFQPAGAIYLAGHSMGGIVAYEVARQLHRQGRRVALLGLLDSVPVGRLPWVIYGLRMASYIPRRCLVHCRKWWGLPFQERVHYLRERWAALGHWLRCNGPQPALLTAPPPRTSEPPEVPGFQDYYVAVASSYKPRFYPGSADIFVSEKADSGWRWYWRYKVRGGISFHQVSGDHIQMLQSPEYLPGLANSLTAVLLRAQAQANTTPVPNGDTHANHES